MDGTDTLGGRIKTWRIKKGWSQRKLAQECGLDVAWISRLENGKRANISLDSAQRIARALGVTTDYLAGTYTDPERVAALQAAPSSDTCRADGALWRGGTDA